MTRCDCPTELEEEILRRALLQANPRERLLVELGMETGLRISELLSLTVRDVWDGQKPAAIGRPANFQDPFGRSDLRTSLPMRCYVCRGQS